MRNPPKRWIYVEKAWDATPIEVELGAMEEDLCRVAKYRFLDADKTWTLIPWEQAKQLKLRTRQGTLQLLAQTLRLAWTEDLNSIIVYEYNSIIV